ncbi:ABC transporter ATP-binding protein [Plantactinospora sp. GCM10030261]|uniref:ABC transporter ATP-binding protein n=1 Tax=Plantactinospora sp. GCM10030261 TaxID=3273420 RepID=UPI00361C090F
MVLRVDHVCKEYRGGVRANDDISFQVGAGQVHGLLGHNGAGKTTLVNQVAGLVRPTSGTIRIDTGDPVADPGFAHRVCSVQPQAQVPLLGVTPRQAITLVARIRGASRAEAVAATQRLIDALDISEWADTPGERLSGGVRRLTAYCLAAVRPGRVIVLDEPSNDVDPVRRRLLWQHVRSLADDGPAVLLVTHNLTEVERILDRLSVLAQGRVVAEGTVADLRADAGPALRLDVNLSTGRPEPVAPPFAAQPPRRERQRLVYALDPTDAVAATEWATRLQAAGAIDDFSLYPMRVEDIYLALDEHQPATDEEANDVVAP